jgi:chromosome segregation ATPase
VVFPGFIHRWIGGLPRAGEPWQPEGLTEVEELRAGADALGALLGRLRQGAETARTITSRTDREVTDRRQSLKSLVTVVKALRQTQFEQSRPLGSLLAGRTRGRAGMSATRIRVGILETKVCALGDRVDGLGKRFDKLENRLNGLETRFDGLEAEIEAVADRFGTVRGSITRPAEGGEPLFRA